MEPDLTTNQWRTAFGALAALASFLLVQTDIIVPPFAKVVLGGLLVVLAAVNPVRAAE
jgi:hypothetical protein